MGYFSSLDLDLKKKDWFDEHIEIIGVDKKTKKAIKKKIIKELKDEIHNSDKS
tara:strand:+ start:838 stop:996 length:159 start_codon:yes stop_codon:yes gene_type:complete